MEPLILLLLLLSFCIHSFSRPIEHTSKITVEGFVFCDICNNFGTQHSYRLTGVDVHIQCKFKSNSQIFSANTTTNEHGGYIVELPFVEGVDCVEGQFICQATSIRSSSSTCNVIGLNINPERTTLKFQQHGLCIYALDALTFTPPKRNITLCGNQDDKASPTSLNSPNTFLPKLLGVDVTSPPIGSGGIGGSGFPCFPLSRLLGFCGGGSGSGSGFPCLPFLPLPGCNSGGGGGSSGPPSSGVGFNPPFQLPPLLTPPPPAGAFTPPQLPPFITLPPPAGAFTPPQLPPFITPPPPVGAFTPPQLPPFLTPPPPEGAFTPPQLPPLFTPPPPVPAFTPPQIPPFFTPPPPAAAFTPPQLPPFLTPPPPPTPIAAFNL